MVFFIVIYTLNFDLFDIFVESKINVSFALFRSLIEHKFSNMRVWCLKHNKKDFI